LIYRARVLEYLISFPVTYVAILVTSLRWLRVAQREHYIAGSVAVFAVRWWTVHWGNLLFLAGFAAMAALSYAHPFWGVGAASFLVFLPAGLTLRGRTSKLEWTPRAQRVFFVVALLYVLAAAAGVLGGRAGFSLFVLSGLASPAIVDLALALMAPVERRLSEKYVREAQTKLAKIAPLTLALTGSYGKTTTKRYAEHLLAASRRVFATPGSFNNRLGIARAINESMPSSTEVFIAEIGTYGPGEIAEICGWLNPEVVALLAVGPVHLERFGSLDAIAAAKAEILDGARIVVANADDERVKSVVEERAADFARVVWYSLVDRDKEVFVEVAPSGGTLFLEGRPVGSFDAAIHIGQNVAAAAALALAAGSSPEDVGRQLDSLPSVDHRRSVGKSAKGTIVIDDTYNSNPAGAAEALDLLDSLRGEESRAIVVTPGMVELGDIQFEENSKFARTVCQRGCELVVVGYTNRKALLDGARSAGSEAYTFDTRDEAVAWVRENLAEGDVVLYENDLPDHYP
jgi:UDP-N-acetylmuramoyl-tripeptide--D-alanyl-D-alanine ligase